jgi:anti-anti-sigma factor
MDNKLTITKETNATEQLVTLKGRLDASWSAHLDEYLDGLVREGSYRITLDMSGIQYMSSAGIRILVNQYKKISGIGGQLLLRDLSPQVTEVLNMVGMLGILTKEPQEIKKETSTTRPPDETVEIGNYRFVTEHLSDKPMTLEMSGDPTKVSDSGYTEADNSLIRFSVNDYGLGLGAIGSGFEDCRQRYGEFIAAGGAVAYKPSDGSKIPDYTLRTGRLEPEVNALYAIRATGHFSHRVSFEPGEPGQVIAAGELAEGFARAAKADHFVFLIIAENGGLIGASLDAPPVGGHSMFGFPAIREKVNFTTEPAYQRMLSVVFGIYARNPDEQIGPFLRPVEPGSSAYVHMHAVVFPFQALPRKETSAAKLVMHLFETSIAEDVLHLISDTRDINGLGSSTFKQGVAWIGKL